MTDASMQALAALRSPANFQWYVVPIFVLVLYVYVVEVEKRNWHIVLTGLIYYLCEFSWEMFNALILEFTQYSALWTTPGDSAFIVFVGLNIEISMMFSLAGVVLAKTLPKNKQVKLFGLPNRWVIPLLWGSLGALVETLLNRIGVLVWAYKYWNWPHIWVLILAYSIPFYLITWVYDSFSLRAKKIALGVCLGMDLLLWVVLVELLGWV